MTDSELVERVDRDPLLSGDEKETTITMYGLDKRFTIYSAKPTVVKSLLKHDYFQLKEARLLDDGTTIRIQDRDDLYASTGDIVTVRGTMPVGVLTVKSKPRATNHQSSIVNPESVDPSVFE